MRLLIATGIYPPDIGGPAIHVKKLAEKFRQAGLEVSIVAYGSGDNFEAVRVSRKIPLGLRHLLFFIKCLLHASKSDIIYAYDATAAGLPACLAAKIFKKKFIIRIGGDLLWERAIEQEKRFVGVTEYYAKNYHQVDKLLLFKLISFVLRRADIIIVPALLLKKIYLDFYGIAPEKIKIIPNPLEQSLKFIDHQELCQREPIILFAGRFTAYKNLEFLIRVFDKVRNNLNKGKLHLIGDGPLKNKLTILVGSLPSASHIKIIPALDQENLFKKIQACSFCIGPALTEFNPNFILECLSFGKPVLLSHENGLSVKLPDSFLFDPKNTADLEKKITFLLTNKSARQNDLNLSFTLTWQDVVNQHLDVFHAL